jgi:hypothetical protein
MAFGFPAYHTDGFTASDAVDLRAAILESIESLDWTVRADAGDRITASTGMGIRSFGEKITIAFLGENRISITSRCALVTQCLDWGKNKANVGRLLSELGKRA